MNQLTTIFLENPNEKNLKIIGNQTFILGEIFDANPTLAKRFFTFDHWHLLYRSVFCIKDKLKAKEIQQHLLDNVKTFDHAVKYFYTLNYEERIAYQHKLVEYANSVKELTSALYILNGKYRTEIVKKMRQVAVTNEEISIANSYQL